ncbi:MAG: methylated-DNA--[protein]-cysteine S-methyltransferase [Wenzhouxiangella sp.]
MSVGTPLGPVLMAEKDGRLAGVWFSGQRHFPAEASCWLQENTPLLKRAGVQLAAYFAGELSQFDLPLATVGTPFQQAVWRQLVDIPYGQTRSYGQIALALGKSSASRAVGMAVGRNPWSIIVPCHRVLGSSGQLTGYAGGLDRKRWLLALESEPTC